MACSPRQALSCAVARVKVLGAWPSAGLCRSVGRCLRLPLAAPCPHHAGRICTVAGALAISAICVCSFAFVLSRCSQRLGPFLVKPLPNMTSRLSAQHALARASSFCVVSLRAYEARKGDGAPCAPPPAQTGGCSVRECRHLRTITALSVAKCLAALPCPSTYGGAEANQRTSL